MLQNLNAISSDRFTWKAGNGSSEYSDLSRGLVQKIFDDAVDVGFVISSTKTGREIVVLLTDAEYDRDNDLISHTFTAWYERINNKKVVLKDRERFEVKVYND